MSDILTRKEVAELSAMHKRKYRGNIGGIVEDSQTVNQMVATITQAVELLERYDRWANKAPWEAEPFDNDRWTADVRRFLEEYDKSEREAP